MKSQFNIGFSGQEKGIDNQYRHQSLIISQPFLQSLNISQFYEKSISSSFLPMPQLYHLNSSISFDKEYASMEKKQLREIEPKEDKKQEEAKIQQSTKPQFQVSFIDNLELQGIFVVKKLNTKNVLRNFGNAQNQYVLYNKNARLFIQQHMQNVSQFDDWVRKLVLLNFKDYQNAWHISEKDSRRIGIFKKVYKQLCWWFYQQQCIPYIFNSRLTYENKKSHLQQISKMLKGVKDSLKFEGFKE